jgi:hypothetical protein
MLELLELPSDSRKSQLYYRVSSGVGLRRLEVVAGALCPQQPPES